jgi:hypothetical protein
MPDDTPETPQQQQPDMSAEPAEVAADAPKKTPREAALSALDEIEALLAELVPETAATVRDVFGGAYEILPPAALPARVQIKATRLIKRILTAGEIEARGLSMASLIRKVLEAALTEDVAEAVAGLFVLAYPKVAIAGVKAYRASIGMPVEVAIVPLPRGDFEYFVGQVVDGAVQGDGWPLAQDVLDAFALEELVGAVVPFTAAEAAKILAKLRQALSR